jgi:hypothetical protein
MAVDTKTPACLYRAGGQTPGDSGPAGPTAIAAGVMYMRIVLPPHFNDLDPSCEVCQLVSGPQETLDRRRKGQPKAWWTSAISMAPVYGRTFGNWKVVFDFDKNPNAHGELKFVQDNPSSESKLSKRDKFSIRSYLAKQSRIVFLYQSGYSAHIIYSA